MEVVGVVDTDGRVDGCVACDSLRDRRAAPGGVIYENQYWLVDHRPAPTVALGYLFIKLKRHGEHLAQLTPDEAALLGPTIRLTCRALTQVLRPEKVHVASWGEGVKHIHFHVLARLPGMPPSNRGARLYLRARDILRRLGVRRVAFSEEQVVPVVAALREACQRAAAPAADGRA